MEKNDIKLSEEFVLSQKSLREAVAMSHDAEAAKHYRLMFNHEKNVSVLDSYAELLLNALIGSENKFVEEDLINKSALLLKELQIILIFPNPIKSTSLTLQMLLFFLVTVMLLRAMLPLRED